MIDNPEGFHVFEDFLTQEECESMAAYIDEHSEADPKPLFRFFPILFQPDGKTIAPRSWDPDNKMEEMIVKAERFVLENYNLWGSLYTNRIHGNIMDAGSQFYYHTDEDPNDKGEYDGAKRTYVGDLFLNDDYVGGEFGFTVNGEVIKFKPKAGSLVIFPGYNTSHGIEPITSGRRINIMNIMHDVK
jgi:hypothetical protein